MGIKNSHHALDRRGRNVDSKLPAASQHHLEQHETFLNTPELRKQKTAKGELECMISREHDHTDKSLIAW